MNKKGIMWLAILGFVVFIGLAPIWLFPSIEDKLDMKASGLESVSALDNSELEFNGRNGYLIVPANIDKDIAEFAANEIEGIQGVRNVKIIYDESKVVDDDNDVDTADIVLGKFKLDWTTQEKNIDGELDEVTSDKVEDIFKVSGLDINTDFNLSDETLSKLEIIGKDLFTDVVKGILEVDGDNIKISGTLSKTADIDDIEHKWGGLGGVELDLDPPEISDETEDDTDQDPDDKDDMLEFDNIEFEFAKITITPESEAIIDKIAQVLADNEDVHIDIIGHTDSIGYEKSNQNLSVLRAEAVLKKLVEKGIDASRMIAYGMGETMPIDTNDTDEGNQKNRRVEIIERENN